MSDEHYSFSSLSAFTQCPLMYKFGHIDRLPGQDNAFGNYGTFCHKLLEEYANGKIPAWALAEAYEEGYDSAMSSATFPPYPKGMGEKYYQAGLRYFSEFTGYGDEYEILAVEKEFSLYIRDIKIVGFIDLILRHKETGEITVVDHKSKSRSSMKKITTYLRQLYIYAAYIYREYHVYPRWLKFNMFREGFWIEEEFSQETYDETMDWVQEVVAAIRSEVDWEPHVNHYFCRWVCSYLMDCPCRDEVLLE